MGFGRAKFYQKIGKGRVLFGYLVHARTPRHSGGAGLLSVAVVTRTATPPPDGHSPTRERPAARSICNTIHTQGLEIATGIGYLGGTLAGRRTDLPACHAT